MEMKAIYTLGNWNWSKQFCDYFRMEFIQFLHPNVGSPTAAIAPRLDSLDRRAADKSYNKR